MTSGPARAPLPVVLLHGLTDSAACWPAVLPRLVAAGRRVVALDARGHGGQPVPDEPFTIAALAADAEAALRALDLGPAVVVGHSMGGVTAQELALTAPDLVAALVLEDPAWREAPVPDGWVPDGSAPDTAVPGGSVSDGSGTDAPSVDAPAPGAGALRSGTDAPEAGAGAWGSHAAVPVLVPDPSGVGPRGDEHAPGGRATDAPGADDVRLLGLGGPQRQASVAGRVVAGVRVLDDPGRPKWLAGAIEALTGSTAEQVAAQGRADNPGWSAAEIAGWAEAKTRVDPRLLAVPHDWTARPWVEALVDVRVPVTLLTVAPGRGVVTATQAARAAHLLGDRLTHVPVAGAGHNIRRDAPAAYLAALDAALRHADTVAT